MCVLAGVGKENGGERENEYGEDVIKKIGSTLCSDDIDILKKLAEEKKYLKMTIIEELFLFQKWATNLKVTATIKSVLRH